MEKFKSYAEIKEDLKNEKERSASIALRAWKRRVDKLGPIRKRMFDALYDLPEYREHGMVGDATKPCFRWSVRGPTGILIVIETCVNPQGNYPDVLHVCNAATVKDGELLRAEFLPAIKEHIVRLMTGMPVVKLPAYVFYKNKETE